MLRIDAHHHLWRYRKEEYEWIGEDMLSLRRNFLLDDLRAVMREANVDGTIAVQARQTVDETRWLLHHAERGASPLLGVVGWLPLASANLVVQLEEFLPHPSFKGLRHVVQGEPDGFLSRVDFNRGIRSLASHDLVYEILIYARQLPEAIHFVDTHPAQSFVVDHIAKPCIRGGERTAWSAEISELARRPNVTCKLSGMVTEADPLRWTPEELWPYFDVVLQAFGANRLMVGTDWPVLTVGCSYGEWWRTIERWIQPLTEEEQGMILGGTASRIYRLQTRSEASH